MDLNALKHNRNALLSMQREVEQVSNHAAYLGSNNGIGIRPTYRAIMAQRGFLVQQTLGSGTYSKVKKALNFTSYIQDTHVAMKIIDRMEAPQDYQQKFLPRELLLWPSLQHPHLITLHDIFQDPHRVFMVLEYAPGGDCLQFIQKNGAVTENAAKTWTSQVCDAVRYMHDCNIVHRDLKLENLLLDARMNIKICDFGFVKKLQGEDDFSKTYCGSKSYAAPEILMGVPYDATKSDIWAIGVILYIFVTGKMPFDETKGTRNILKEQKLLDFRWLRTTKQVSLQCVALILHLFTWSFHERPDIHRVISHSWFKSAFKLFQSKTSVELQKSSKKQKNTDSKKSKSLDISPGQSSKRRPGKVRHILVASQGSESPPRKVPTPPQTASSGDKSRITPCPPKSPAPKTANTLKYCDRHLRKRNNSHGKTNNH